MDNVRVQRRCLCQRGRRRGRGVCGDPHTPRHTFRHFICITAFQYSELDFASFSWSPVLFLGVKLPRSVPFPFFLFLPMLLISFIDHLFKYLIECLPYVKWRKQLLIRRNTARQTNNCKWLSQGPRSDGTEPRRTLWAQWADQTVSVPTGLGMLLGRVSRWLPPGDGTWTELMGGVHARQQNSYGARFIRQREQRVYF